MADRLHQAKLRDYLAEINIGAALNPLVILAFVVPGGGKSRLPGIVAEAFPRHRIGWYVPRLSLRHQGSYDMKRVFGIDIRESGNEPDPCKGARGFVATHQALAEAPSLWEQEMRLHPYIVVFDEMHHAKVDRDGEPSALARAVQQLFPETYPSRIVLNMSGTLETNDRKYIHSLEYEETETGELPVPQASCDFYLRYTREQALRENALVPIEFHHADGPVKFIGKDGEKSYGSLREVRGDDEGNALFTALHTAYAVQLFDAAVRHFRQHGRKLLVVCDRQRRAEWYATKLRALGIDTAVAVTDNAEALSDIKRFKDDASCVALSTCAMAYEGLDVPEITHIVCLTHIRSVPWIEQMLARAWRSTPWKRKCWAFVPDDHRMNLTIQRIHAEQLRVVPFSSEGPGGDGPGERVVVPIESMVERIRAAMLDGCVVLSGAEAELLSIVQKYGIEPDDPAFIALVKAIEAKQSSAKIVTLLDEETRLRNGIADACREADSRSGVPFGTYQKRLMGVTHKSIREMTITELKRAADIAARLCA